MSKSAHLRLTDLRQVFRLVGNCRDLGADADRWRRYAFEGITRLPGARAATGGEVRWVRPDGVLTFVHPVVTGFSPGAVAVFARFMRTRDPNPATDPTLKRLGQVGGPLVTRTRRQLVADGRWYRSVSFNEHRRVVGVDHCIYSVGALPGECSYSLLGIHRALSEHPFNMRAGSDPSQEKRPWARKPARG